MTADGEIVVGVVGSPVPFLLTIFGAPRTVVRPSSSSCVNFARGGGTERDESGPEFG